MTNSAAKTIVNIPAHEETSKSFLEYSMSVVYARAIPDARDGLKPVQRRLLYSMYLDGYTHDKGYVKSARPVSSCMGQYHPHGDSSIYQSLVTLTQPHYMYVPFGDGYGNWGDVTGSPAAASRYTETRLAKAAQFMVREVKENTVDMRDNYDNTTQEPVIIPAMLPNLLINGNFGIGVGFASNFASHNPSEVMEAVELLVRKPDSSLDDVMKVLPGPDFPTGAEIIGTDGIRESYETGAGRIRLRAKVEIVPSSRGKHELIFSEMPYGVKTVNVIAKIKDGLKDGKLAGLADAKDLTDRKNGLKVVVETKAGVNPEALLATLFKETPLEETFGINNTALVDGNPRQIGLLEIISIFIAHRRDVVRRRSQFRRDKRAERMHLVDGLLSGLKNIDEVIRIVRGSENASAAQEGLMKKFKLDEVQADYILSIALRRLTKYDQVELSDERQRLADEIKDLDDILNSDERLKKVILEEIKEVRKELDTPRRSVLINLTLAEHEAGAKETLKAAAVENGAPGASIAANVVLTFGGEVLRSAGDFVPVGRGVKAAAVDVVPADGRFALVSSRGTTHKLDVSHVHDTVGTTVNNLVPLEKGERILCLTPVEPGKDTAPNPGIVMVSSSGKIKTSQLNYPQRADEFSVWPDMGSAAADSEEIIFAKFVADVTDENNVLSIVSSDGSLLSTPLNKIRPQGIVGNGMAGLKLAEGQTVATAHVWNIEDKDELITTYTGVSVKSTPLYLYPLKGRGGSGVRTHGLVKTEKEKAAANGGKVMDAVILFNQVKEHLVEGSTVMKKAPYLVDKRDGSGEKIELKELSKVLAK